MFTLTIETDNAAFEDDQREEEIARILEDTAKRVRNGALVDGWMRLRDSNGNTGGHVELKEG
jgi:hypothetical protein